MSHAAILLLITTFIVTGSGECLFFTTEKNLRTSARRIFIYLCSLGLSYNQPKLSLCASWSETAKSINTSDLINGYYTGIFIDEWDTMYVLDHNNSQLLIWNNASSTVTKNISHNLMKPWSIFVTMNREIYVDNGYQSSHIDKWTLNATNGQRVMDINGSCTGLFIDINQNLYCSLAEAHSVLKADLMNIAQGWIRVVGTGCPGPVSNMLYQPHGIFVDVNFDLYVADTYNNRIQHFAFNQSNGNTVAGFGSPHCKKNPVNNKRKKGL